MLRNTKNSSERILFIDSVELVEAHCLFADDRSTLLFLLRSDS